MLTSYGLAEGGDVVAFSRLVEPLRGADRDRGRPFRGMKVRIADPETDEERTRGEVGRILVRGPGLFDGYQGDPGQTAEVMRGGWLHTATSARWTRPAGSPTAAARKDMLKVGGENVAALEIEAFLPATRR